MCTHGDGSQGDVPHLPIDAACRVLSLAVRQHASRGDLKGVARQLCNYSLVCRAWREAARQVPISAMLHEPSAAQLAWLSRQALGEEAGLFLSQPQTPVRLLGLLGSTPRFAAQLSARGTVHLACGPGLVDPSLLGRQLPPGCRLRVHLSGDSIALDLAGVLAGCRELHISVPFSFRGTGGVVLRLPGPPPYDAAAQSGSSGGGSNGAGKIESRGLENGHCKGGSWDSNSSGGSLQGAVESCFLSSGASLLAVTLESLSRGAGVLQGPCRFVRFAWDGSLPGAAAAQPETQAAAAADAAAEAPEAEMAARVATAAAAAGGAAAGSSALATPEDFTMGCSLPLPDPPPAQGSQGALRQGWVEPLGCTWAMRRCVDPANGRLFVRQELCSIDPGRYSFAALLAPTNVAALQLLARPRALCFAASELPGTVEAVLGCTQFQQRCGGLLEALRLPLLLPAALDLRPFGMLRLLEVLCPAEGPCFLEHFFLPPGLQVLRCVAASPGSAFQEAWLQRLQVPFLCKIELAGFVVIEPDLSGSLRDQCLMLR